MQTDHNHKVVYSPAIYYKVKAPIKDLIIEQVLGLYLDLVLYKLHQSLKFNQILRMQPVKASKTIDETQ